MFWSGNFMAVRELNSLLKEENVTLASVLEADDILQECKADNKALIQFLTRPDILAELVTLITEEPPKNVKLSQQYRLASIACEVLTSHLATLSDRLTMDTAQMNRLCDFLNQDPPLNPLLASYFSKTVEMLLERSSKQDWYLYHIVCLRVLDFFKSRRDFLPNLLRHLATSAVADTFKYLIRLDDLFNKPVMEWLEQHQFIDSLIGIICGSYAPEPYPPEPCPLEPCPPEPCPPETCPPDAPEKEQRDTSEREYNDNLLLQLPYLDTMVDIIQRAYAKPCPPKPCPPEPCPPDAPEKGQRETSQKEHNDNAPLDLNNSYDNSESAAQSSSESPNRNSVPGPAEAEARAERARGVAAHNAAALLSELVATGCAAEGACARSRTAWQLAGALAAPRTVRALLSAVFTCAPRRRARALHHAARLLLQLLHHHAERSEGGEGLRGVELAVAPHLPLLHQALLRVAPYDQEERGGAAGAGGAGGAGAARVGAARVSTAALLAQLALSDVEEVASTLLTLGTPGLLVELLFAFPQNNFLHAQVVAFCRNALSNRLYRLQYATHLFVECDLLTRLMDAFQENEIDTLGRGARAGYMGHVVSLLGWCGAALGAGGAGGAGGEAPLPAPAAALRRLARLQEDHLAALLHRLDTPLGGSYPSENMYDTGEEMENISDTLAATYDDLSQMTSEKDDYYVAEMSAAAEHGDSAHFVADGLGLPSAAEHDMTKAQNSFLELASQRFDDDMWEDSPEPEEFSQQPWGGAGGGAGQGADAPVWEGEGDGAAAGGEGWAQFDAFSAPPPKDPFAPYWAEPPPQEGAAAELCAGLDALALATGGGALAAGGGAALASNLLTAMSGMTPAAIANIVNANLQPLPMHAQVLSPSSDGPPAAPAPAPAPLPCDPAPASNQPTGVTSPKEVTLPAEVSLTTEVTLPNDLKSDFPDSSNSNPPIKENCVTPLTEIPDESISSEILTEGEVDDLSDKVSEVTDIAVEAEEATEPAAEATEASER